MVRREHGQHHLGDPDQARLFFHASRRRMVV